MKDRYLYRAKRLDNEEWVEGFLVNHGGIDWIYTGEFDKLNHFENGFGTTIYPAIKYTVDPSTICQCTGLKDKNGKMIWENDIVHIPYRNLEDSVCKVIYQKGYFVGELADGSLDCIVRSDVEVIGNIFDNPDLLDM